MADRRMLAKTIIESDAFSCMPPETQMLYVRLNMAADDDGFVPTPRSVMRMCGASEDSMKLLITKKFVLTFEQGDNFIFLIKHWKIHNYIRNDRYKASTFRSLLREVYYDENKAYSMTPGAGKMPVLAPSERGGAVDERYTNCLPDGIPSDNQPGDNVDTQVRLGKSKDRVGKESIGKEREEKDNNSLCKIEEIGESEGEEQTAAPDVVLSGEAREKRIAELRDSAQRFLRLGFPPDSIYCLAQAEGIDPQEIAPKKKG